MKIRNLYSKLMPPALAMLIALALSMAGCTGERTGNPGGGDAAFYLSLSAVASSINTDNRLWEDRVDEVRMLAFETGNGQLALNQKLWFPDGFDQRSRAVKMPPGIYDFYFIANETVYPNSFVDALEDVDNMADFTQDTRFFSLGYNPQFTPDGTSAEGRFLMSAVYENITVESGGTEAAPLPLALPTARVELIRSHAKVEVTFRKRTPGGTVPDNAVSSVLLQNLASTFSVPPLDETYDGAVRASANGSLDGLDYGRDSIGSVVFYIPEFLVAEGGTRYTELVINNTSFPIETDEGKGGLAAQRRSVAGLSDNSVIRNYHYQINAYIDSEGGIQIRVYVDPWIKETYRYMFQGDQQIIIPPVIPTDSTIIIPTDCGMIELMSDNEYLGSGLLGAYNDQLIYYDPEIQGPRIERGEPPYYCEKKYGPGWRLINSCELMSFLALFDYAYNIWTSNTWEADTWNRPYYALSFRQAAQTLLEALTGRDLSSTVLYPTNNWSDGITDLKLGILDEYFTPGDLLYKQEDFPGEEWPFASPPGTGPNDKWIYNEVVIQVKAYWYGAEYINPGDRGNWDRILHNEFERYDYSSTVSRCVRPYNAE